MFLFGKEKSANPLLGNLLHTDMHSHLVPGVDDGAKSLEESIFLIENLIELGYKKLITTPHIYPEFYPNKPEDLRIAFNSLVDQVQKKGLAIELELAAEYYLDSVFEENLEKEELLNLVNKWVLIETSMLSPLMDFSRFVFKIKLKGFQPILAHPERYRYIRDINVLAKMKENGCLLQINILSLIGSYGNTAKNMAWALLEKGMVDFLGTDLHREKSLESLRSFPSDKKFLALLAQNPIKNSLL